MEYAVRYRITLGQCDYKIFRVWIEAHVDTDRDEPDWPDHLSERGNAYFTHMRFRVQGLRARNEFGNVVVPQMHLAGPDHPKFTTNGDGEGVDFEDTDLHFFGTTVVDPTSGWIEVEERIGKTDVYELLLLHPEDGWAHGLSSDYWPGHCDPPLGRNARAPLTFTVSFTPGCTVCGTPRPETLRARRPYDVVVGFGGADRLLGSGATDLLYGYRGNDVLIGGGGKDWLYGQDGDDTIRARDGRSDRVRCGNGRDTAVVDERDHVRDCERVDRG